MQTLQAVSIAVVAASIIAVMIVLVPVLLQIRRMIRRIEDLSEAVRVQVAPLSHDLTVVSKEVSGILQSVHRQVDQVQEGVATIQGAAERLRDFEEVVLTNLEEPLGEMGVLIRAASQRVGAFARLFRI